MLGSISFSLAALSVLTAASPVTKRSISGPILNSVNFPDPSFVISGSTWYAYSTNSGGHNVPMATSPDFQTWTLKSGYDALPTVGAWSTGKDVWAPDVVQLANGLFIMYYCAESTLKNPRGNEAHCFGAASSTTAAGPFTPVGDAIQCHLDQGGAIDPAGFRDSDGRQYVVYKIDGENMGNGGNCNNAVAPIHSTPIMLQEVDPTNGWSRIGDPIQILDRDDGDGPLIEAPSLTHVADANAVGGYLYILFFSSNCYDGGLYDTSWATSTNGIRGPYTKTTKGPLFVTGTTDGQYMYSPGGLDVGPGAAYVMFHSDVGTTAVTRAARTGAITIDVAGLKVNI